MKYNSDVLGAIPSRKMTDKREPKLAIKVHATLIILKQ